MHKRTAKATLNKLAGVDAAPEMDSYRVREALQTIHRAEEFKRDRPLMKEVKRMAKMQVKAVCK